SDATCEQRNDHTSQRSDMMLLPKWARWAGLGLCAAMVPAMAAVAKPATHKKTNTSAQHATATKTAKSSKTATAKHLSTSKHSAKKLSTSSKSTHAKKLTKTSKSHTALTRQHSNKAT